MWAGSHLNALLPHGLPTRFVARTAPILVLAFLVVASSGCITELLTTPERTERVFACSFLTASVDASVRIRVDVEPGLEPEEALQAVTLLVSNLSMGLGVDDGRFQIQTRSGPAVPKGGWSEDRLTSAYRDHDFLVSRNVVELRVAWVTSLGDLNATGAVLGPGVVAVSFGAAQEIASPDGLDHVPVAASILMHYVGHALGLVNGAIPMLVDREGEFNHDLDRDSVLHPSWHHVERAPAGEDAWGLSVAAFDDLRFARDDVRGVCA